MRPVFNHIYENYILTFFVLRSDRGDIMRSFHELSNTSAKPKAGCVLEEDINFHGAHILLTLGRDDTTFVAYNPYPVYPKTLTVEQAADHSETLTKSVPLKMPTPSQTHTDHGVSMSHSVSETRTHKKPQPPAECGNVTSYRAQWNVTGQDGAPFWNTTMGNIGNIVMRLSCSGKTLVDLTKSMLTALTHNFRFSISLDGNHTIIDQSNSSLMPRLRALQAITIVGWFPKGADTANFMLWAHTIGICQPENGLVTVQPAVRNVTQAEVCEGIDKQILSYNSSCMEKNNFNAIRFTCSGLLQCQFSDGFFSQEINFFIKRSVCDRSKFDGGKFNVSLDCYRTSGTSSADPVKLNRIVPSDTFLTEELSFELLKMTKPYDWSLFCEGDGGCSKSGDSKLCSTLH